MSQAASLRQSMQDSQSIESVFLAHLPAIERIIATACRRQGLRADAASDFGSWAKLKLIEDDYAVLRRFRGDSSLTTYLTVVVAMLLRDYRAHHWGRWRPSAAAQRMGRLAVRVETMLYRDRLALAEVGELLRSNGETECSDAELAGLVRKLPRRPPLRPMPVSSELIEEKPSPTSADERVNEEELNFERSQATTALRQAMQQMPVEDSLIIRLHFDEGMSLAEIARALSMPQKPLYRRLERLLGRLRTQLEAAGFSRERVALVISEGER